MAKQLVEDSKDPYARRYTWHKWNRSVRVTDVYQLFRVLPEFSDWTKDRHIAMAREYHLIAQVDQVIWQTSIARYVAMFGEGDGVQISGVYRAHFPEPVKELLRYTAHRSSEFMDRSLAHWRAGGKTIATWRRGIQS